METFKAIFPVLLIILNIGAAAMCIYPFKLGEFIYYLAAAVLNIAVAFLM